MESSDCGKTVKLSDRQQLLISEAQNCAYKRVEIILNSNQCKITENQRSFMSSNKQ